MSDEAPTDKQDDDLLPCPHCGGEASFGVVEDDHTNFGGRYIDCATCGASTNLVFPCKGDVERELRERWNRRTPPSAEQQTITVTDRQGDFAVGQDRIFPDSAAITKQFRVQYAEKNGLTDECYPYSLKDGDVVDAKGRRITIAGNRGIRDMLNEIAELRAAVAQRTPPSASVPIIESWVCYGKIIEFQSEADMLRVADALQEATRASVGPGGDK